MYGAIVQIPKVLKKRVVKTQKKSRSLSGAKVALICSTLDSAATAITTATTPRAAATNHQIDTDARSTTSSATTATTAAATATAIGAETCRRVTDRMRSTGCSGIAAR